MIIWSITCAFACPQFEWVAKLQFSWETVHCYFVSSILLLWWEWRGCWRSKRTGGVVNDELEWLPGEYNYNSWLVRKAQIKRSKDQHATAPKERKEIIFLQDRQISPGPKKLILNERNFMIIEQRPNFFWQTGQTKLKFKLYFPGNLGWAAFAILALFYIWFDNQVLLWDEQVCLMFASNRCLSWHEADSRGKTNDGARSRSICVCEASVPSVQDDKYANVCNVCTCTYSVLKCERGRVGHGILVCSAPDCVLVCKSLCVLTCSSV